TPVDPDSFPTRRSSDLLLSERRVESNPHCVRHIRCHVRSELDVLRRSPRSWCEGNRCTLRARFHYHRNRSPIHPARYARAAALRSEEHTSELQSRENLV